MNRIQDITFMFDEFDEFRLNKIVKSSINISEKKCIIMYVREIINGAAPFADLMDLDEHYFPNREKNLEGRVAYAMGECFKYINKHLPSDTEILFICDNTAEGFIDYSVIPDNVKIMLIPFWFIWAYCTHKKINQASKTEFSFPKNFLFLPGKINKRERIAVLQMLHKNKWFDEDICTWSTNFKAIPKDSYYYNNIQSMLDEWKNYENAITNVRDFEQYDRQLDCDLRLHTNNNFFHHTGIPYDVDIFNRTGFSIITETNFGIIGKIPLFSEKTSRTIYNTMPFIQICNGVNGVLKSLGFKTFEDIYGIEEFSYHGPELVDQLTYAVSNMLECKDIKELESRAVYNRKHLIEIAEQFLQKYENSIIVKPVDHERNQEYQGMQDWILHNYIYANSYGVEGVSFNYANPFHF